MPRALPFLFALLTAASLAPADTLTFENGDSVNGRFLKIEEDVIHFESEQFGIVTAAAATARVQLGSGPAPRLQSTRASPETKPPLAVRSKELARGGKNTRETGWKRTLELGYTAQSGRRDRTDLVSRAQFDRIRKTNETRVQARYLYGETNSEVSTDALSGSLRHRQAFSPRTFAQAETRYDRDEIKGIAHDASQSLGLGRTLVDDEAFKLKVGGGASGRYRTTSRDGSTLIGFFDAFQELSLKVSKTIEVSQDLTLLTTPFVDDALTLKLNAALKSALSETIGMTVRYEYEYDLSLDPDARTNQRVITSLAYKF